MPNRKESFLNSLSLPVSWALARISWKYALSNNADRENLLVNEFLTAQTSLIFCHEVLQKLEIGGQKGMSEIVSFPHEKQLFRSNTSVYDNPDQHPRLASLSWWGCDHWISSLVVVFCKRCQFWVSPHHHLWARHIGFPFRRIRLVVTSRLCSVAFWAHQFHFGGQACGHWTAHLWLLAHRFLFWGCWFWVPPWCRGLWLLDKHPRNCGLVSTLLPALRCSHP